MPNETLRIAGIASVSTRSPLGSTVRRTVPPRGSSLSVRVTARVEPPADRMVPTACRSVPGGVAPGRATDGNERRVRLTATCFQYDEGGGR
ncbi:hypothetical protein GCM10009541_60370 [Micromonospora gifhornensis]|uniref:Uncharacterized protein n=1 Tax=Micromonospora gifhornensis TaxID=84594 RepID=A0ABQ4IMH5_9ACTN|nr:hypothetical protein Vgi01_56950 [Micromonospora gifhornensis]